MKFDDRITKAYDFDDVLIRPTCSSVESRDEVNISVKLQNGRVLNFPLIASPMSQIITPFFVKSLSYFGGMGIYPRDYPIEKIAEETSRFLTCDCWGIALKPGDLEFDRKIERLSVLPTVICVDTANGYRDSLLDYCENVKDFLTKNNYPIVLMSGNVVTRDGCVALSSVGCDLIRVGIGGGSVCSTRNQTGIGVPNISALLECSMGQKGYKLVIDGGIKNSGDFVKAIVAGADLGMAGKLFAQTFEAGNDGYLDGMASREYMEENNIPVKSVEGFRIPIEKKYCLDNFVKEFAYGIKSAGTYLNARSLEEIRLHGKLVEVTDFAIKKGI